MIITYKRASFEEELQNEYDCLTTQVASGNLRALNAHVGVGFEFLKTQVTNDVSWNSFTGVGPRLIRFYPFLIICFSSIK